MSFKQNITNKAAESITKQSDKVFQEIIRIQESMHAHLELILQIQRLTYDEIRAIRKHNTNIEKTDWKDETQ